MTQKWLVPIDGSDIALHSVAWIVRHVAEYREPPQIHLINIQAALPDDIGRFIDTETLREYLDKREARTGARSSSVSQLMHEVGATDREGKPLPPKMRTTLPTPPQTTDNQPSGAADQAAAETA